MSFHPQTVQDPLEGARRRANLRSARSRATARQAPDVDPSPLEKLRRAPVPVPVDLPSDLTRFRPRDPDAEDTTFTDAGRQILARTAEGVTKLGRTVLELGQRIGIDDPRRTPQAIANLRAREATIQEIVPDPEGVISGMAAGLVRETPSFLAASVLTGGGAAARAPFVIGRTLQRARRGAKLGAAFEVTSGDVLEEGLPGVAKEAALFAGLEAGVIGPLAEIFLPSGGRAIARNQARAAERADLIRRNRERRVGQRLIEEASEGRIPPERQLRAAAEGTEPGAIPLTGETATLRQEASAVSQPERRARGVVGPARPVRKVNQSQNTLAPTAPLPSSRVATASRKASRRQATQDRVRSEPEPSGRAANKPPTDADTGPLGPVDNIVEQNTGKVIPDERTSLVRQKQVFVEGEGGFIELNRDALEVRPERGLEPHSKRIQSQISVGERTPFRIPSVLDWYTSLVRRAASLESAAKGIRGGRLGRAPTQNDLEAATQLASGSPRRAEAFLEYGPGRWTPEGNWEVTGTPGLLEILAPLRGKLNQFRRYVASKRAIEVGRRDLEFGINLDDAAREVSTDAAEITAAQRQYVAYGRDVARYYQQATDLPESQLQKMFELGESYMPVTRVFEGADPMTLGAGTAGRPATVFRRFRGSRRRFIDPIESMVDYTKRMVRAADINRIGKNLIDLAEANPERSIGLVERIERVPTDRMTLASERLRESSRVRGIEMSESEALEIAESLGAENLNLADDVLRVWRDGELQSYRLDPSIAKGIRAMQPRDMNMFIQLLGLPSRGLRAGVTLNPGFQIVNMIRDSFDAAIQTQYGFRLGVDSFAGFYQSAKAEWLGDASKVYQEFASAGGGFSTLRGAGRRTTQAEIRRILPKVETRTGRTIDVLTLPIRHPIEALKRFGVPFEEAARVGEFMRAKTRDANTVQALMASQDVTVNFQQTGASEVMQALNYITSFLNAGVQSLDIAIRTGIRPVTKALAAREAGETAAQAALIAAKEAAKIYGTAIGAISIPSMLFWSASRDDVEVQDLQKSSAGLVFWFYRDPFIVDTEGNPEIARVTKPFLWGQIFGTGMEAILDQMVEDDPEGMARWAQGIREQAQVNILPNVFQIMAEQYANKDLFFGTPIVPQELENVEPSLQSTERTTRLAMKLGELTNQSPARIDAVMRDIGGTLPADILRLVDASIDRFEGDAITEPAPMRGEAAFFGRFFARQPTLSVEPVEKFWENARASEEAMNSFELLRERGDEAAMDEIFDRRFEDFAVAEIYEGSRRRISDIRSAIDGIRAMPNEIFREGENPAIMKRQMINEYLRQYIEVARVTNEVAAEIMGELEGEPN